VSADRALALAASGTIKKIGTTARDAFRDRPDKAASTLASLMSLFLVPASVQSSTII